MVALIRDSARLIPLGRYSAATRVLRRTIRSISQILPADDIVLDVNEEGYANVNVQPNQLPPDHGEEFVFASPFTVVQSNGCLTSLLIVGLFNLALACQLEATEVVNCGSKDKLLLKSRRLYIHALCLSQGRQFVHALSEVSIAILNNLVEIDAENGDLEAMHIWQTHMSGMISQFISRQHLYPQTWKHFCFVESIYGTSLINAARAA